MTKEDYNYIESTLRELSLFVRERKEEENQQRNHRQQMNIRAANEIIKLSYDRNALGIMNVGE